MEYRNKMQGLIEFKGKVDPFVIEGDPNSGLLAKISKLPPGEEEVGTRKCKRIIFGYA